jgi:mannosyltransferase
MRMYPLGALLAVLSSWALHAALFRSAATRAAWIAYAGLASALIYTHNYGLFTVAAQALFAFGYLLWSRVRDGSAACRRTAFRRGALAFLTVGLAYLPWLPVAFGQNGRVVADYWTGPLSLNSAAAAVENLFTADREFRRHPDAGPAAALAAAALLGALLLRKDRAAAALALLSAVPFALALAVSLVQGRNILGGRYLSFSSPFLLIGIALVVCRLRMPALRAAVSCLLIAGFAFQVWLYRRDTYRSYTPGLQDAARVVREGHREGDLVVTRKPVDFFAMNYYLRPCTSPFLWLPADTRLADYDGRPFLRDGDLLRGQEPLPRACRRIWFIKVAPTDGLPGPVEERYRLLKSWTFHESIPYRYRVINLLLYEREDKSLEQARAATGAAVAAVAPD